MTTKKCVACGEEFVPSRSSQKYCPECREKGRTAEYYEHRVELNRMHAGDYTPKVFHNTCKVCGKEFVSVRVPKDICSVRCQEKRRAETAKCPGAVYSLLTKEITQAEAIAARRVRKKPLSTRQSQMDCIFLVRFAEKCLLLTAKTLAFVLRNARRLTPSEKKKNAGRNTRKIALQSTRSEHALSAARL